MGSNPVGVTKKRQIATLQFRKITARSTRTHRVLWCFIGFKTLAMLSIFLVMCGGIVAGWLLRDFLGVVRVASRITTLTILLLMLILGMGVGANKLLMANLGTVGLLSAGMGATIIAGMIFFTQILWKNGFRRYARENLAGVAREEKEQKGGYLFSFLILGLFAGGICFSLVFDTSLVTENRSVPIYILYTMMSSVGITIGSDTRLLKGIVKQSGIALWVPVITVIGSWASVTFFWVILALCGSPMISWTDSMAVGSGFGYYSLSGVLLNELRGPQIGTIALLANVTRELIAVVGTPWMARRFSPLAPICCGGATALDVTLPGIIRFCGPQFVALAIFQGIIADLLVPFLVPFFATV